MPLSLDLQMDARYTAIEDEQYSKSSKFRHDCRSLRASGSVHQLLLLEAEVSRETSLSVKKAMIPSTMEWLKLLLQIS